MSNSLLMMIDKGMDLTFTDDNGVIIVKGVDLLILNCST